MADRRNADNFGARKESEHAELLQQIEDEKSAKKRKNKRAEQSASEREESELDEFEKNDKYGSVLQSDLDKITGGMQTVKASNLNLDRLIRNNNEAGAKPTQGDVNFLV
jgi:predicted ribosome quality control (RQC) complex YloA/Tae2 family protein